VTGAGGSKRHQRVEVFYDGACPVCRASRAWAERRDRGHRLDWLDATAPGCADRLPASAAELAQAVWVRRGDGSLASGYRAWLAVLGALPGWGLPARLLALAPLAWLGPAIYRLVAVHRHRLGGG
jgi:predicted DCC family thiol-disulfide oxidoreductase YuxK